MFDKVDKQKMPPPSRKRPDPAARARFLEALRTELCAANLARQQAEGRVVLRRLNRVEYESTLHDLLAIDVPLQHFLPEDTTTDGFDNVALGLRLSMLHMEHYLEAADAAIAAAMDFRRRPERMHKRLRYHDEESVRDDVKKKEKKTFRVLPDAVVIFDDNSPTVLRQWIVPARGRYRIRISGRAYQAAGRPAWLKLYATDFKTQRLLAYFDMPADKPRLMEVVAHLEAGQLLNLSPFDTNYDDQGRRSGFWGIGAETYPGRGIAIEWVEVEGPLFDAWPPQSVGRLFGELPVKPVEPARKADSGRRAPTYAIAPGDPRSAAETVLQPFASRAFRRPVTPAEVQRFVKLAHRGLDDGLTFEDALGVAFRAVITSPRFLFLEEHPGPLDDWALAARLSYFLWSTQPDDELRKLAASGTLCRPQVLNEQVERMLDSPRSRAFVENFVGQWLDLRQIDFTLPDRKLYPEFDDILKAAMVGETQAFFAEMLREDFEADQHHSFRLPDAQPLHRGTLQDRGCNRGGVPPRAAAGRQPSRRRADPGERTQGDRERHVHVSGDPGRVGHAAAARRAAGSPARRYPGVRARYARRHVDPAAARQASVDGELRLVPYPHRSPRLRPGELRRDRRMARALSREKGDSPPQQFRGRRIWEYGLGPPVNASGELLGGRKFTNIDEFKELLLQRQDQVARNLAQDLLTYATGAGIQFADRDEVDAILARVKTRGGGLRTLVHEIVQSRTFRNK